MKNTMPFESCKDKLLGLLRDVRVLETELIELYASMSDNPCIPSEGQCPRKCSEAPAPRAPHPESKTQDWYWAEIPRRVMVYRTDPQAQRGASDWYRNRANQEI